MKWGVQPDDIDDVLQVARLTGGIGADGVIVTAASSSDEIVSAAFRMCRKKARVVLVGDVGLDLQRADFYSKELDFLISTSYGPGRYDVKYEEGGLDYPLAYVRWTEGRNMAEYLRLIADGALDVKPLSTLGAQEASVQAEPERLFKPGERVRLTEAPFAGIEGIYQMANGERRVMVLIELLSKQVRVRVAPANLRKIS